MILRYTKKKLEQILKGETLNIGYSKNVWLQIASKIEMHFFYIP